VKTLKLIGLAALAAMALMAYAGVGTAAASETMLCKSATNSPSCAESDRYPEGTTFEAVSSGKIKILNGPNTIECNSTAKGQTGKGGEEAAVNFSSWTFSNCNLGCKEVNFKALPSGSLRWGSGSNGTLNLHEGTGRPTLSLYCPFVYEHCTYTFPNLSFQGGSTAQLVATKAAMKWLSGTKYFCKGELQLEATFNVNSPTPAYLAVEGTLKPVSVFCKVSQTPCSPENIYPEGTVIKAKNVAVYPAGSEISFWNSKELMLSCESQLEGTIGDFIGSSQRLTISKWILEDPGFEFGSCENYLTKGGQCAQKEVLGMPYQASLSVSKSDQLAIAGAKFHFYCGFGSLIDCTYTGNQSVSEYGLSGSGVKMVFGSGKEPGFQFALEKNLNQSGKECPGSEPIIRGPFKITEPTTPIYISWM
jgi:hypothetical protein